MTTTVKVHVNGQYKATVRHFVDGKQNGEDVIVGPQEEKVLHMWHDHENTFTVKEEPFVEEGPVTDGQAGE